MNEVEPKLKPIPLADMVTPRIAPDIDDLLDEMQEASDNFPLDDYEDLENYLEPYQNG